MPPPSVGFDSADYPGDLAMQRWKSASPYSFAAYYLKSPEHPGAGFMGKRAFLHAMGWAVVPIYVGRQNSPAILSAAQGELDAADAARKLAAEGFSKGTYVYLDIEYCDAISPAMLAYAAAWGRQLPESGFRAGMYSHKHNAASVRAAFPSQPPRFWIAGGAPSKFNLSNCSPADSGIPFADLWQCPVSARKTFGGSTILIDENVSSHADPSL